MWTHWDDGQAAALRGGVREDHDWAASGLFQNAPEPLHLLLINVHLVSTAHQTEKASPHSTFLLLRRI